MELLQAKTWEKSRGHGSESFRDARLCGIADYTRNAARMVLFVYWYIYKMPSQRVVAGGPLVDTRAHSLPMQCLLTPNAHRGPLTLPPGKQARVRFPLVSVTRFIRSGILITVHQTPTSE